MCKFKKPYGWIIVLMIMIIAILMAILTGCGGGGNNPPLFSNSSLNGVYYSSSLNINPSGTTSSIEKIIFDGNGNFTFEQIYGDTTKANQTQTGSGTYMVNSDGTFTITDNGEVTDGRLSADARTFVTARINDREIHNISTGVKAATSGFSDESLKGVYYSSSLKINSTVPTSSIEKFDFDGNGNFTFDQIYSDSTVANQTQSDSGTYMVNTDGTFTITYNDEIMDGRLSADAKTFVTAIVNDTATQSISTGVKAVTSSFSNASLNGVYYSSSLNINSSGTTSSIDKYTFDGNGNFKFEQIYSDQDGGNQTQTYSGTYEVNTDGSVIFKDNGEVIDGGRLSADAKTFVTARINDKSIHNISTGVKH